MFISVTQKHIDEGKPCNPVHCPISKAFSEATDCIWTLGATRAILCMGNKVAGEIPLPDEIQAWIKAYDADGKGAVQPITFEIPDLLDFIGLHMENKP